MAYGSRNSDNLQIAHVWAQQTQSEGTAKGGNVFFKGATIYSYGYHFPMAVIVNIYDRRFTIINSDTYSSTTSTHQAYVRQAVSGDVVYANTEQLKTIIRYNDAIATGYHAGIKTSLNHLKDSIATNALEFINKSLLTASKAKQARSKEKVLNEAKAYYENAYTLLSAFGLSMPATVVKRITNLHNNAAALIAKYETELTAAKKRKEKAEKQRIIKEEALAVVAAKDWLAGEFVDYDGRNALNRSKTVYMRIEGDEIVTTKGARFPVKDAVLVFTLVKRIKQAGKSWVPYAPENHPEDNIEGQEYFPARLGHFTIDKIDEHGNVTAGCHYVEWPQIEYVAKQLKLI